jgi:replication initiation and membrane attachment protein
MIEHIMIHQKLSPGIVNVLLHFAMIESDMKLPKSYINKLASHWARKNIKTVIEAMDFCVNEKRKSILRNTPKKVESNKKVQDISYGILLNLLLLESSHHLLIYLHEL